MSDKLVCLSLNHSNRLSSESCLLHTVYVYGSKFQHFCISPANYQIYKLTFWEYSRRMTVSLDSYLTSPP